MKIKFDHTNTYYVIQKIRSHKFFKEFDGLAKHVLTEDPSKAFTRPKKVEIDWYIQAYASHFKGFKVVKIVEKSKKEFEIFRN